MHDYFGSFAGKALPELARLEGVFDFAARLAFAAFAAFAVFEARADFFGSNTAD